MAPLRRPPIEARYALANASIWWRARLLFGASPASWLENLAHSVGSPTKSMASAAATRASVIAQIRVHPVGGARYTP